MSFYRSSIFRSQQKNSPFSLMPCLQESLHCLKARTELHVPYHLFVIRLKQHWVKLVLLQIQYVIDYWSNFTNISNWRKVQIPYCKQNQRSVPVSSYFKRFKPDIDTMCPFCNLQSETTVLLLWYCNYTNLLSIYSNFFLFWENVLFAFIDTDNNTEKAFYSINL